MPDFDAILNELARAELTPMELARKHGLSITQLANAMAEAEHVRAIENIAKLNAAHRKLLLDRVKTAAISTLTEIATDGGGVAAHATPAHTRMMETRRKACVDLLRAGESRPRQRTTRSESTSSAPRPTIERERPRSPAVERLEARARARRASAAIDSSVEKEREAAAAIMVAEIMAARSEREVAEAESERTRAMDASVLRESRPSAVGQLVGAVPFACTGRPDRSDRNSPPATHVPDVDAGWNDSASGASARAPPCRAAP